jgi:hypothetical protein
MKSITVLIIICFKATIVTKTIKNNLAEDEIDETNDLLRRNSGCSAEQKIIGIPEANSRNSDPFCERECSEFHSVEQKYKQTVRIQFQTIPQNRLQVRIPFHGTKVKANFRNFIPKHFAGENFKKDNF